MMHLAITRLERCLRAVVSGRGAGAGRRPPDAPGRAQWGRHLAAALLLAGLICTGAEARYVLGTVVETAPEGARVISVAEGGAAQRAGLRPDDIITRINGHRVHGHRSLVAALQVLAPDLRLEFLRAGQSAHIDLQVAPGAFSSEIIESIRLGDGTFAFLLAARGFMPDEVACLTSALRESLGANRFDLINEMMMLAYRRGRDSDVGAAMAGLALRYPLTIAGMLAEGDDGLTAAMERMNAMDIGLCGISDDDKTAAQIFTRDRAAGQASWTGIRAADMSLDRYLAEARPSYDTSVIFGSRIAAGGLIIDVDPNSPAARAGMMSGWILLAIDDVPVDEDNLEERLTTIPSGHVSLLRVLHADLETVSNVFVVSEESSTTPSPKSDADLR